MAVIRPFRALHYGRDVVGDLAPVIAPPYDVIDDAHWQRLFDRSPFNVVRLILNRAPDPYRDAAKTLASWWHQRVIIADEAPCLYYYVQNFELPNGEARERRGLMGAVRLERFGEGTVYPHERTFPRAKEDRLRLVEACRTNLSPIFGVYPDRADTLLPAERRRATEAPWIDLIDEFGQRHRLWRLARSADIAPIMAALRDAPVFIADGHHRYETALAYRDQRRAGGETDPDAPHQFVLMYLASMDDAGLVILPTHRVLRELPHEPSRNWIERLHAYFEVLEFPLSDAGAADLTARLDDRSVPTLGVRVADRNALLLLRLRDPHALDSVLAALHPSLRSLGVTVLDALILRHILSVDCTAAAQSGALTYTHRDSEALEAVTSGRAAAAFLMRPPSMREVQEVCLAGQTMPQKSTYFYPKLLSGLVFHSLDDSPQFAV